MFRSYLIILPASVLIGVSCVSTGKFKAMQQQATQYDSLYNQSMRTLQASQEENKTLTKQKAALQDKTNDMKVQLTATQENNTLLKKQLQAISAISTAQAESIRKSIDNMGAKDTYIMALQSAVGRRDSANMAMILELKAAIGGYSDQGVSIKLENGVVSVDMSDSLLFYDDSTSFLVSEKGKQVLSRLSRVLNDQPAADFIIEGHCDTLSAAQDSLMDSWDLSAKRATNIARLMVNQYRVSPGRITAAGRGEFAAAATTDSLDATLANHRIRVIIQPLLEPVLHLLDHRQDHRQDHPEPATQTPPAQQAPSATPTQTATPTPPATQAPPTQPAQQTQQQ